MRFKNYILESCCDPKLKEKMDSLRRQIKHVKTIDPKDPQLSKLRKELNDLRMKAKDL